MLCRGHHLSKGQVDGGAAGLNRDAQWNQSCGRQRGCDLGRRLVECRGLACRVRRGTTAESRVSVAEISTCRSDRLPAVDWCALAAVMTTAAVLMPTAIMLPVLPLDRDWLRPKLTPGKAPGHRSFPLRGDSTERRRGEQKRSDHRSEPDDHQKLRCVDGRTAGRAHQPRGRPAAATAGPSPARGVRRPARKTGRSGHGATTASWPPGRKRGSDHTRAQARSQDYPHRHRTPAHATT